ncbi:MAG: hypothetical protein HZB39_14285 [Planctomycetes bacterium]|nr:hypothetical protein [Planctomycetota bacterium]
MTTSSATARFVPLSITLALGAAALAQESVRDLERPGENHKHLTVNTVDRWRFEGHADEVIRFDVASSDFDPVIALVKVVEGDRDEVVLADVDDDGSRSHALVRLASAGRYAILVHGPNARGGGNYRLYVERLKSVPMQDGGNVCEGRLDDMGMAHVRFLAQKGETVVPHGAGVVEFIDPKGRSRIGWEGCHDVELDGEHYVRVHGAPDAGFRVGVERARVRDLGSDAERADSLSAHGIDEWRFEGRPDEFRRIVLHGERIAMRVIPRDTATGLDERAPLVVLTDREKGGVRRLAVVLGRDGGYRVQVLSRSGSSMEYRLRFDVDAEPLAVAQPADRELALGASEFFAFDTTPGQVLRVDVAADAFDPLVRLTAADGRPIGENDDGGGGLASRHGWFVQRGGLVRAQVACVGDGGGGRYRIALSDVLVPALAIGAAKDGTLGDGATEYWHLDGRTGQSLFLSARSATADLTVTLIDPYGVVVGSDDDSGADRDALFATRLSRDGRHTVVVTARSGRGAYSIQAIDPSAVR